MTLFLGVDQRTAQGINLLFFLPAAFSALVCHTKNGYLDKPTLKTAVPAALIAALAGAWISNAVDVEILRKPLRGSTCCCPVWGWCGRGGKSEQ